MLKQQTWVYVEIAFFKEVINTNWNNGETLIQDDWCPYKKSKSSLRWTHTQKTPGEDTGRGSSLQAKERSQEKAALLVLNLGLSASRTLRKSISAVWATHSVLLCCGGPGKPTQGGIWPNFPVTCWQSPPATSPLQLGHHWASIFSSYLWWAWVSWNRPDWLSVVFFQSAI